MDGGTVFLLLTFVYSSCRVSGTIFGEIAVVLSFFTDPFTDLPLPQEVLYASLIEITYWVTNSQHPAS
jgi:hypothetical protein